MPGPISARIAWQAITACAGLFALACALAAPVDLWRLAVKSHQGEPLRAIVSIASLPQEKVSTQCLSMGPESDAPGSDMPFLGKADLRLNAAGNAIEISTRQAIDAPALALVLRVQCKGAPLYARHFTALIPPAAASAVPGRAEANAAKRRGFYLSLLQGDSVESIAAVIFPGRRSLQQKMVRKVIAGNPGSFPDQRNRKVAAGTVLWFPDLRDLRRPARTRPSAPAESGATDRLRPDAEGATAGARTALRQTAVGKSAPHTPIRLRRALALGEIPGTQECRQLAPFCATVTEPALSMALELKTRALQSGVRELHLKQDGIDQQLQRLEQSLKTLQGANLSAAAPKVEIRTVVKTEPLSWTIWLGLAGLILGAAAGGFAYGRRNTSTRSLVESDAQLDRMLASAATAMRELESVPKPASPPRRILRPVPGSATRSRPSAGNPARKDSASESPPAINPASEIATQVTQAAPEIDFKLDSGPQVLVDGLSNSLRFELDQALDKSRSMFTDVDRFIALGRAENALSLLQFQVQKNPKDRDAWIKLMAVYQQEKMDAELTRAAREFSALFPNENRPLG